MYESVSGEPLGFTTQLLSLPGKHVEAGGYKGGLHLEAFGEKEKKNNSEPSTV